MKELQDQIKDKLEVTATAPELRKLTLLGQLRPQKGQQCYQLHVATGVVTLAEFDTTDAVFGQAGKINRKIVVKEGCIYNVAINKKCAQKKFIKMLLKHLKSPKSV